MRRVGERNEYVRPTQCDKSNKRAVQKEKNGEERTGNEREKCGKIVKLAHESRCEIRCSVYLLVHAPAGPKVSPDVRNLLHCCVLFYVFPLRIVNIEDSDRVHGPGRANTRRNGVHAAADRGDALVTQAKQASASLVSCTAAWPPKRRSLQMAIVRT